MGNCNLLTPVRADSTHPQAKAVAMGMEVLRRRVIRLLGLTSPRRENTIFGAHGDMYSHSKNEPGDRENGAVI
jgi:hypothetical protein